MKKENRDDLDKKIQELEDLQRNGDQSKTTKLRLNSLRVLRSKNERGV